jgi:hypothetical protein
MDDFPKASLRSHDYKHARTLTTSSCIDVIRGYYCVISCQSVAVLHYHCAFSSFWRPCVLFGSLASGFGSPLLSLEVGLIRDEREKGLTLGTYCYCV